MAAMAGRSYGEGSVYQRKDGRWVATFEAGWTPRGTRRRVTVTAKTKPDVLRRRRAKQRELDAGAGSGMGNATVKSWSEVWLATRERELRPKAYAALAVPLRRWVVPTIGKRRLDKLTPADLRLVADAQRAGGLSPASVHSTHKKTQQMLKAALIEGYTVPERVLALPAPPKGKHDRQAMPLDQVAAVLDAAVTLPDGGLRWVLALVTGLRQGEVLGITRAAVDPEAGAIFVDWQLQELRWRDRNDKALGFRIPDDFEARQLVDSYHLTRPKTAAGQRQLHLPAAVANALRGWLMVAPPNPWDLLWCSRDLRDGRPRPRSADDDRAEWYALQDRADVHHPSGRHWYVHELRNTAATQMAEAGVDDTVVTALMGHTSIVTSRGYVTARQEAQRAALERVAGSYGLTM